MPESIRLTTMTRTGQPPVVRLAVRVQPRASRSGFDGAHGAALKIRVHAPPVDGAANEAVIALLAAALAVPKRDVRIASGETARTKIVEISGVSEADVRMRLAI